jgi:hypothetical protein
MDQSSNAIHLFRCSSTQKLSFFNHSGIYVYEPTGMLRLEQADDVYDAEERRRRRRTIHQQLSTIVTRIMVSFTNLDSEGQSRGRSHGRRVDKILNKTPWQVDIEPYTWATIEDEVASEPC